jgi:hypothetical protein
MKHYTPNQVGAHSSICVPAYVVLSIYFIYLFI